MQRCDYTAMSITETLYSSDVLVPSHMQIWMVCLADVEENTFLHPEC